MDNATTRKWADVSSEEQKETMKKMTAVIKEAGVSDKVKLSSAGEYVGILGQGKFEPKCNLIVSGTLKKVDSEKKDLLVQALKEAAGDIEVQIQIACKITVGDHMGVIKNATKVFINEQAEEGECDIEHKEGQVLLLDLWATWCPPCQKPMAHNQEMLKKEKPNWADKVRLIGLSIDNDANTVKNHVESRDWKKVEHYHVGNGKCVASKEMGSGGVPHVLLVDTTGHIVFKGHPASIDIEAEIDGLLEGKKMAENSEEARAAPAKTDKEMSGADAAALTAKFTAQCEKMCADAELKEAAGKLMRAFFVLTNSGTYDEAADEMKNVMTVHTIAMGGDEDAKRMIREQTEEIRSTPDLNCQTHIN